MSPRPDVLIHGAGIIGLSLALELRLRGHHVRVADPRPPLTQASVAAAGMLAAEDPFNPSALRALARFSVTLYPAFLARLHHLAGLLVPFQTERTQQVLADGSMQVLAEHSVDPRQLAPALHAAVQAAGIVLELGPAEEPSSEPVVVYARGAWPGAAIPVVPRKGQMLRVRLPEDSPLTEVIRNAHSYVVPRTTGPQAGTALVGATLEDAGFDLGTTPEALASLRQTVSALLPSLQDTTRYPAVEAWAGLRPATSDELPILGTLPLPQSASQRGHRQFAAAGHFRNGILLAPATARVLADLIEGMVPEVDLTAFSVDRFRQQAPHG